MTSYELDITLLRGKAPLTLNQRLHRMEEWRRKGSVRSEIGWQAKAAKIGTHDHIIVRLHFATGDNRHRDEDNLIAIQKPAVDGLVDARVIPEDTPKHLTWHSPLIHTGPGKRRLWLEVTTEEDS